VVVAAKTIPVRGREGPKGCETSRLPHFLDNRLTDGCKGIKLTCRPLFKTGRFCYRLSLPKGCSAAGRITSIEKSEDLIGNRAYDPPACNVVLQPTTLPHGPQQTGELLYLLMYLEVSLIQIYFVGWVPWETSYVSSHNVIIIMRATSREVSVRSV
jgi:hypothetical protein